MSRPITIMLVGGGSGGHLTPLLAVASALKTKQTDVTLLYIGQKQESLSEVLDSHTIDKSMTITAGKFRRYHSTGLLAHVLDIKTLLLNIRDFFRFLIGTVQAWSILRREKPDVIFLKGGFVSVPVGIAARLLKIPYCTHDSDAIPGLANRITAKHAKLTLTALETNRYPYEQSKARQVGIPLQKEYTIVSEEDKKNAKRALELPISAPVLVSVGGGLGARRINQALAEYLPKILAEFTNLHVIHLTGKKLFDETVQLYEESLNDEMKTRMHLIDFSTELYTITAAADIIVARAGATNIAECAVQAKACIIIPNPYLTGGQQLHNAEILAEKNAAIIVQESELQTLPEAIAELLKHADKRKQLADSLHTLSKADAADAIADILLSIAAKDD